MVVPVEDGVAGDVGNSPVERVGQLAVEGREPVALGVVAGGEVARVGRVAAVGAGAGAEVPVVAVVHAEDEAGGHGGDVGGLGPAGGLEDHGAVGGVDWGWR